jgi:hypothetical protein
VFNGIGSDQINPFKYQDKCPIPGQYFALNGPFLGQNDRYKAVEHPEAAAFHYLDYRRPRVLTLHPLVMVYLFGSIPRSSFLQDLR